MDTSNDNGVKPRMVISIDDDIHIEEVVASSPSTASITTNDEESESKPIEGAIHPIPTLVANDADGEESKADLAEEDDFDSIFSILNDRNKMLEESEPEPWTRDDMEQLSNKLTTTIETTDGFRDKVKQLIPLCDDNQLPKGMRTIIRYFSNISDISTATKALIDYYLETNDEPKFATIQEGELKTMIDTISKMLEIYGQELQEALDKLEEMIRKGEERVVLNQQTRPIKNDVSMFSHYAERQAKAFSKAIESYAPDQDPLPLLERFAVRNDKKVMTCIDNTLNLAGTSIVMVEDAPKMIEALENNDTKAIIELQKKMIDNLFDNK